MGIRSFTTVAAAVPLALAGAAPAVADNVIATPLTATVVDTGATTTVAYRLSDTSNDRQQGCNADDGTPAVVTIHAPAGLTASPSRLTFAACDNSVSQPVTFTGTAPGTYAVTASVADAGSTATTGTYDVSRATATVTVRPPNQVPVVAVTGVEQGAAYVVGSVPAPGCRVTDDQPVAAQPSPVVDPAPYDALGAHTASCSYGDAHGAHSTAFVDYTVVRPPNTAPRVAVTGIDATRYEIGSEPTAGCAVTDAEDGPSSAEPVVDRSGLTHGLGTVRVTCDAVDSAGAAAPQDSRGYDVVDTGAPTITGSRSPAANEHGWHDEAVTVAFDCADSGSGIASCEGGTTLSGEGAGQSVTGTATDHAGNTATDTVSGIDIDRTAPVVQAVGGPADGASYSFGRVPAAPTCDASDALSGLLGGCTVTGGGSSVGSHRWTLRAEDHAGHVTTVTVAYTVLPWTAKGFTAPVDAGGVWNTVKGGSTVPLKFELFAGEVELTSTSAVASFTAAKVTCGSSAAPTDEIELTTTGGTAVRYDATGGQFVQNWQTPRTAGACYRVAMTAADGQTVITALFRTR